MGLPVAGSASTLGAVGTRAQALRRPIPRRNTPHFVSIASLLLTRSGASGLTAAPHSCPSRRHAIWGSVHTASAVYHHRESHTINLCKVNRWGFIRSGVDKLLTRGNMRSTIALTPQHDIRRESTAEPILTEPHRRPRHRQRTWALSGTSGRSAGALFLRRFNQRRA